MTRRENKERKRVKYKALKGVQDLIPPEIELWQHIEDVSKAVFKVYGYKELRVPIIESTDIFLRSIGETTDIVEKEMYTFPDKAGRSITLRPEGTAPVVRAFIEHNLFNLNPPQKFYYHGPMFRYERPQAGRFRQFYQIGVEAFGIDDPKLDAEIICMLRHTLEEMGLTGLEFELNSIGCSNCRPKYRESLKEFLSGRLVRLCPDCQRRFELNPLRIMDCKVTGCIELRQGAPRVIDFLCEDCRNHFDKLKDYLQLLNVSFAVNPDLVRGLDYYTKTTFEVTTTSLGAQKAVAAGGRYDRLVEEFGGPPTPAIGFAIGAERIASLLKDNYVYQSSGPVIFFATLGGEASATALKIADSLRTKGLYIEVGYDVMSLKSQMKRADRLGALYTVILGEDELKSGKAIIRDMQTKKQSDIPIDAIEENFLNRIVA